MKQFSYLFCLCCLLLIGAPAFAQVTNLIVNDSTTSFTMTSGDTVQWQYTLPAGATATAELWYDVNTNGTIESNTDVLALTFTQTDGQTNNHNGPPDMDTTSGKVSFTMPLGFAPGHWIIRFTENSVGESVAYVVLPIPNPPHVVKGTVYPPSGKSAAHLLIQMEAEQGGKTFWQGLTDSLGRYTIMMNADTAGNPWKISIGSNGENPFAPAIQIPDRIYLTIADSLYLGNDFSYTAAAAQVAGVVKDQNGNLLSGYGVYLYQTNTSNNRQTGTNENGFFRIGILPGELGPNAWNIQTECDCESSRTGSTMMGIAQLPVISLGDSLYRILRVYTTNSTISGHVMINGTPAVGMYNISAFNADTAQSQTITDNSGNFSINVSSLIHNYSVFTFNMGPNMQSVPVLAHAGDTGIVVNITITDIKQRNSGIPAAYSLQQNYPNPFNPTSVIDYDIPVGSHVTLSVFNVIGKEVMTVVNQQQVPGKYRATIDASSLPSGIYFYRLNAGTFTQTRKMILMK